MLDFTQYDKKSLAKVGNVDSSSVLVLEKDSILRLEKDAPSLRHCTVGLSWDAAQDGASPVDLDLSALYIVPNERITKANVNERFCYYGNPNNSGDGNAEKGVLPTKCYMVQGTWSAGDDRFGKISVGKNDNEEVYTNLDEVPAKVAGILYVVSVYNQYEDGRPKQTFGAAKNAYVRLIDRDTNKEIARYSLAGDYSTDTVVEFCTLERDGNGWVFHAIGNGSMGTLLDIVTKYGA